MTRFILFQLSGKSGGKDAFAVVNKDSGATLGTITWYPRWRQYVLQSAASTVWSVDCLQDVITFMSGLKAAGLVARRVGPLLNACTERGRHADGTAF